MYVYSVPIICAVFDQTESSPAQSTSPIQWLYTPHQAPIKQWCNCWETNDLEKEIKDPLFVVQSLCQPESVCVCVLLHVCTCFIATFSFCYANSLFPSPFLVPSSLSSLLSFHPPSFLSSFHPHSLPSPPSTLAPFPPLLPPSLSSLSLNSHLPT